MWPRSRRSIKRTSEPPPYYKKGPPPALPGAALFCGAELPARLKIRIIVPIFPYTVSTGRGEEPPPDKKTGKAGHKMEYEIRYVGSHVEVYSLSGNFLFSADTAREAMEELAG